VTENDPIDIREKRMRVFAEEMKGESDRAVAVVGAAWVEEALQGAIIECLEPHQKAQERLFSVGGPLATFSAKIDLGRLIGIMSDAVHYDLHTIREIRNDFAHRVAHKTEHSKLSFATPYIRDKCLSLRCVAREKHCDPREAFTSACGSLSADFEAVKTYGAGPNDLMRVIASGVDTR
jgi:hypothetical protein